MDHGHKLFNFHEGYHVNNSIAPIVGSRKLNELLNLFFRCHTKKFRQKIGQDRKCKTDALDPY